MANNNEAFTFESVVEILGAGDSESAAAKLLEVTNAVENVIEGAKRIAHKDGKRAQELLQSQAVQNRIVPDYTYDDSTNEHLWIPNFAQPGQMLQSDFRTKTFNLLKIEE